MTQSVITTPVSHGTCNTRSKHSEKSIYLGYNFAYCIEVFVLEFRTLIAKAPDFSIQKQSDMEYQSRPLKDMKCPMYAVTKPQEVMRIDY